MAWKYTLCCKFHKEKIKYRTFLKKDKDNIPKILEIYKHNLVSLEKSIDFCIENNIQGYRIPSDLFPWQTHAFKIIGKEFIEKEIITKLKELSSRKIIYSMHPSQFAQFSTQDKELLGRSLEYMMEHFFISEHIGCQEINIHVGGAYNDKEKYRDEFVKNIFAMFSLDQIKRITVENDELSYGIDDVIYICEKLSARPVLDLHHYNCFEINTKQQEISKAFVKIQKLWKGFSGQTIRIHISSPKLGYISASKGRSHDDFIAETEIIQLLDFFGDKDVMIDVEAKAKEEAIFSLRDYLGKQLV